MKFYSTFFLRQVPKYWYFCAKIYGFFVLKCLKLNSLGHDVFVLPSYQTTFVVCFATIAFKIYNSSVYSIPYWTHKKRRTTVQRCYGIKYLSNHNFYIFLKHICPFHAEHVPNIIVYNTPYPLIWLFPIVKEFYIKVASLNTMKNVLILLNDTWFIVWTPT